MSAILLLDTSSSMNASVGGKRRSDKLAAVLRRIATTCGVPEWEQ